MRSQRAHRSQPMGDNDHRPVPDDAAHVALDDAFALVVQRRCRLVEDEDARICGERAGDRDPLALSAGEVGAALFDHCVVAFGELVDELVRAGETGDLDDLGPRHGGIGEGDVLVDRAVEQQVLLKHHADVAAQPRRIDLTEIRAVEEHLSLGREVEPLHEFRQGRLAGARWADDADRLARRDLERHVFQNVRGAGAISEADVAELDRSAGGRRRKPHQRRRLGRRVEDVAQPLDRDLDLLEVLPDLREAQDRLHRLRSDHVEGDERADAEFAVDHRLGPEQQDRRGRQLADVLDCELAAGPEHGGGKARLDIGGELLLPLRAHDRLDRGGLDRPDADHRLDQELLARRAAIELLADEVAQRRPHREADQQDRRAARPA